MDQEDAGKLMQLVIDVEVLKADVAKLRDESEKLWKVVLVAQKVNHVLWHEIGWTDANECGESSHVSVEDYIKQEDVMEELDKAIMSLNKEKS